MFFLATMSTVTVVSNWSFRSFRNRLHQQTYSQPTFQQPSQPPMTPGLGYFKESERDVDDSKDRPLMLENPQTPSFVTDRSRSRENRLRTPSPTKRGRQFS